MNECTLLTPGQLSAETGWPEKRIRKLISTRSIRFLRNGANFLLLQNAIHEYIARNMVERCAAEVAEDG
jgi:hypothetical protein